MAEKATAPPPLGAMPEAPPSYDQTMQSEHTKYPPQGGGGFAAPPPNNSAPNLGAIPQQQPVIVQCVQTPSFGPHPVQMVCPHCQSQVRTSTDSEPGPMAWILAGILCVVGLWPCACIPCCIESLNSVTHKCPQCKNFLGRYKGGL